MYKIIDGKLISTQIKDELKEKVSKLKEQEIHGALAVIQVGNDPASSVYVNNKKKACDILELNQCPMNWRNPQHRRRFFL